jgi:tetratricopeptide (TPR) repeat protein
MQYHAWGLGNFEAAERECHLAIKLEPLSAIDHADFAWTLLSASKFEEALAAAKTGIELDADSFLSHWVAGLSLIAMKRFEEAIRTLDHLAAISDRHQHALNSLLWACSGNGNLEYARKLMGELEERSKTEYISETYLGFSSACLGNIDAAFDLLEKACESRDPVLIHLKHMPYVPNALRGEPRFQRLLEKIGFPT